LPGEIIGRKKGITLINELEENMPALRADERKIKQTLSNLLNNEIKFNRQHGQVGLRAWCDEHSGHVFQITDNGIGMAETDIPKALAPFQQIDGNLERKYEGTGLGLPLAKSLVELHGGVLEMKSELGVGTTVTIRFPPDRIISRTIDRKIL